MKITSTLLRRIIKILLSFLCFSVFIYFSSCKKKNDLVPAYIHIDRINLSTNYETDGSNSCKITDAWVYIDDQLIGIYELPATFPVLASDQHDVMIRPGVKLNGISMSRGYYPFYQPYSVKMNLTPDKIDTINPTVIYYADKVQWKEDFEEGGVTLSKYTGSDTAFTKTGDPALVFEGAFSSLANLSPSYPYLFAVSTNDYHIPQDLSPVFLELNYKTNNEINIGLLEELSTGDHEKVQTITLNPNTEWKKIYINLTLTANYTVNVQSFKVYFEAYKPDSLANSEIYIDNIKLLYNY